jgi:hypothetical protein
MVSLIPGTVDIDPRPRFDARTTTRSPGSTSCQVSRRTSDIRYPPAMSSLIAASGEVCAWFCTVIMLCKCIILDIEGSQSEYKIGVFSRAYWWPVGTARACRMYRVEAGRRGARRCTYRQAPPGKLLPAEMAREPEAWQLHDPRPIPLRMVVIYIGVRQV